MMSFVLKQDTGNGVGIGGRCPVGSRGDGFGFVRTQGWKSGDSLTEVTFWS